MFAARFDPLAGQQPIKDEPKRQHRKHHHRSDRKRKREDTDEEKGEKKDAPEVQVQEEQQDVTVPSSDQSMSDIEESTSKAHESVLNRFKRTMNLQEKIADGEVTISEQAEISIETRDVAPIPQSKLPRDKSLQSKESKNKSLAWLTTPEYHDTEVRKKFIDFSPALDEKLVDNLKKEFNIEEAFSVQISVIESVLSAANQNKLNPKPFGDYLINAATGSGKTLAYLIPIVQTLKDRIVPCLRCIILAPTKPLISQVYSNLLSLTKGFNLNLMMFKNDQSLSAEHDRYLRNKPDILISTPGRLVDHLVNYYIDLQQLHFLVVDEADRLLNQSFQNWCDLLVSKIEKDQGMDGDVNFYNIFRIRCVKMILSATLTTNSEKLSHLNLFKPNLVVINDSQKVSNELYQLPPNLNEYQIRVPETLSFYKPLILLHLFLDQNDLRTHGLVFTKSNEGAIRLSRLLQLLLKGMGASTPTILSVNSTIRSQERQKIFKTFDKEGGILISTDLVSRGLNFDSIRFVVNYDLPMSTKEYIHRVGRTARANKEGKAITFCYGEGDYKWFKRLVYSGGVINRNDKTVNDMKFIREEQKTGEGIEFIVDLTDKEKQIYEATLKVLESEVYHK